MKIVREETLIHRGAYAFSEDWRLTRSTLYQAIRNVDWPRGSGSFTIYPEAGKGQWRYAHQRRADARASITGLGA